MHQYVFSKNIHVSMQWKIDKVNCKVLYKTKKGLISVLGLFHFCLQQVRHV